MKAITFFADRFLESIVRCSVYYFPTYTDILGRSSTRKTPTNLGLSSSSSSIPVLISCVIFLRGRGRPHGWTS